MTPISTAIGFAYERADLPTRYDLELLADGSVGGVGTSLAFVVDTYWQAIYPLSWEWRIAALHGNLGITELTVTIEGVDIRIYKTTRAWRAQLALERARGNCQFSDPLDSSYTLSGIPAPPSPPAATE